MAHESELWYFTKDKFKKEKHVHVKFIVDAHISVSGFTEKNERFYFFRQNTTCIFFPKSEGEIVWKFES